MLRWCVSCLMAVIFVLAVNYVASADQQSDAQTVVDNVVESFQTKGKEYTLKLMGSLSGPFRKGEIYAYAMTFNGIVIAHPANKDFVGTNQLEIKDANGNPMFPPAIELAKTQGSGWTEYSWLRHGEKEPSIKRTYIKRVPGEEIFIGAGYYVK